MSLSHMLQLRQHAGLFLAQSKDIKSSLSRRPQNIGSQGSGVERAFDNRLKAHTVGGWRNIAPGISKTCIGPERSEETPSSKSPDR